MMPAGQRKHALILMGCRLAVTALVVLAWWVLASRNEKLRAEERTTAQRGALLREIQGLGRALEQARSALPGTGAGDGAWWTERLAREAKACGVTVVRNDARPTKRELGPHPLERRELVGTGAYEAMLKLFGWLESTSPRIRIEEFTLDAVPPDQVRVTVTLLVPGAAKKR